MRSSYFITATDTDAGKTWLTSHWIQALLAKGVNAQAIKPVACGVDVNGTNEDVDLLARVQGISKPQHINAYTFTMPAAPSIAAQVEKKEINPKTLCDWCIKKTQQHDVTLIEGIGGLMVPLMDDYLVMDWIQDLPDCQVVVLVGAKLGCINHAILTLKQLQYHQQIPAYIIINDATGKQDVDAIGQAIAPYIHKNTQVFKDVKTCLQGMDSF